MNKTLFLAPKQGLRVLNPDQNPPVPLPSGGALVNASTYWQRRIADGDVTVIIPPSKPKAAPKEKA